MVPLAAVPPPAHQVLCVLEQQGVPRFVGACRLQRVAGGGFVLDSAGPEPILPGLTSVTVAPIGPGRAEVRGLTLEGVNSRWGRAVRSSRDPACWQGVDFAVCAY